MSENWVIVTVGTFIKMLVDGGDHVIAFKVLEESPEDSQGRYTQKLEVVTIPNGQVAIFLQQFAQSTNGEAIVDDDLISMLEKGILK